MAENEIKLNICYGCMRKLEEGQQICPSCGYDRNAPQNGEDMLPEGTVLFRKYLIGRVLGRGGFGVTYLGYDLDLQLKVAIKEYFPIGVCVRSSQSYNVITASAIEDHTVFSRGCEVFLDEARTLAKFKSPYIVHVRDFFREHGTAYIVMDFEEGITLKAEMRKNGGKLSYERVLTLMEPLIQQLDRLHQRNIIHRDIKPENIMLLDDENGEHLVLLDFGSARTYVLNESRTMTGVVTAGYSPQEQYSQKSQQGPYTDVYALCATIYHVITGVLPPTSIERALEGIPLKSFEECGVNVPKTVEQAIMHGMALKSTERTQTMGQLLDELKGEAAVSSNQDKTEIRTEKLHSGAEGPETTPISRTNKQEETASAQPGAVTQRKSERKPSVVPKFLAGVAAGVLLVLIVSHVQANNSQKPKLPSDAQTLTAAADGKVGPVEVEVITNPSQIFNVRVTSHTETDGIGTNAIDALPNAIVEAQSLAVDSISGATVTSDAIKNAVANAMTSGGIDPAVFGYEAPAAKEPATAPAAAEATSAEAAAATGYIPGTYTAEATGMGKVVVNVTVDESAITAVEIDGSGETPELGGAAVPTLQKQVMAAQGAEIDGVAGASLTSEAVRTAVTAALAQAAVGSEPATEESAPVEAAVPAVAADGKITATGKAQGIDGDVEVQVVADATTIYSVEVLKQNETPGIGSVAVEQLPGAIVAANTYDVDGISGATVTSTAIRDAVKMALESAGFDPAAFGSEAPAAAGFYVPGTYTAEATGMGNVTVKVTVDANAITAIEIDGSGETPGIGAAAIEPLGEQVMAAQSAEIDGVSGATLTSNAVRTAVAAALAKASA